MPVSVARHAGLMTASRPLPATAAGRDARRDDAAIGRRILAGLEGERLAEHAAPVEIVRDADRAWYS